MKKNWRKEMGTDYYLVDLFHGYVFENSKKKLNFNPIRSIIKSSKSYLIKHLCHSITFFFIWP